MEGLHPTIEFFDGRAPMTMISFFTTLREIFDIIRVSEMADIRVIAYFRGDDVKNGPSEQVAMVEVYLDRDYTERSEQGSYPHVVNALLKMFLRDKGLGKAYDSVAREERTEKR